MQKRCITDNRFLTNPSFEVIDDTLAGYLHQLPLTDVKAYLIVEHDEDDDVITKIVKAVCEELGRLTKRPFAPCNVSFVMEVSNPVIPFPYLPLIEITSIEKRVDKDNYESLTSDSYEYIGDELIVEDTGTMRISYEAGYPVDNLPHALRLAALAEIGYRYDNRGDKSLPPGLCETANHYIQNYIVTSYA
jgi:hypothetical protein